ncbi:hypothetical protein [Aquimarina sp. 2201CG5-10]|uniref:hypothetical protein n=1 Tax=Aquimarina callyspongiae TaxID=3098150 RepID=UPI002AB45112|nr:hypothetical protein [Aquimarina sp. 2201CG5-10]MDY8134346.1 hypothetical protein [Aquimarina sp. 2201CG5-10]
MKFNLKSPLVLGSFIIGMFLNTNAIAQSSDSSGKNHEKTTCSKKHNDKSKTTCATSATASDISTSGCSPSSCRGAKTKFGEAKIITTLRSNLIALKANMEKSKKINFEARSYDIHGIVGKTDEESLVIITKEVKIVEQAFSEKLNYKTPEFILPESKAKQVVYLTNRIEALKKLL